MNTMRFLRALYYGEILPWTRCAAQGPEYDAVTKKIEEEYAYIRRFLPPEAGARLEELDDLYTEAGSFSEVDSFAYGLRMGVLFMAALLPGTNGLEDRGDESPS